MTCASCSEVLPENARFCSLCGSPVASGSKGTPDGGLLDPTCGITSRDEAEKVAWEILAPHVAEAKRSTSLNLLRSPEWTGKVVSKRPQGPVPELHAQTPFFYVVYKLTLAREHYEDVLLSDLDDLSKGYGLRMNVLSPIPLDVDCWKVVIDPEHLRLKPSEQEPSYFEAMEDRYYYSVTWNFNARAISDATSPLVVALLRLGFDELRYEFSRSMR
jgi:hypothetical protein